MGKLRLSSRRKKGQYRSNDVREDDVGELTLSSWHGMGKHPCRISRWRRDVHEEHEDDVGELTLRLSLRKGKGRKDMREDEEQGRRTRKEEGGRTTRSTGLRLKLVLRTGISHGLPRFEGTKYRIGTRLGTSCREFTSFTTF